MQTLRRERIQKFIEILMAEIDYLRSVDDPYRKVAELLADAAESRAERKTDETPGEYKPDLVDLELSKLPAMSIRKAIHEYFRLNVNWDTKYSRQWLEWAHEENITAEQIARAADAWRTEKLFNWQPPTLKGIFEKWQLLMDASTPATPQQTDGKGFYA